MFTAVMLKNNHISVEQISYMQHCNPSHLLFTTHKALLIEHLSH